MALSLLPNSRVKNQLDFSIVHVLRDDITIILILKYFFVLPSQNIAVEFL
jgi:hypothetical protein